MPRAPGAGVKVCASRFGRSTSGLWRGFYCVGRDYSGDQRQGHDAGDGDGFVDELHRKKFSLADEPGATVTLKIVELFE